MQASKGDLVLVGRLLGLELSTRSTTAELLAAIRKELSRLHMAAAWLTRVGGGDTAACRARLDALYALAQAKKFKKVRPA